MTLSPVTIYIRFSTYEQEEGTSIQRQRKDCAEMCAIQEWQGAVEIIDRGKSAFKGENREIGSALATYVDQALAGERVGHKLIVERLDRLSRRGFDDTYRLISDLTAAGVTVATRDGREVYRAGEALKLNQIVMVLMLAERAHEESATKAARVRDGKQHSRDLARSQGRSVTKAHHAWITSNENKSKRFAIPERAAVVADIFRMADAGFGKTKIVRKLHADGVRPWGERKRASDGWHESYIGRLLKNRAVLGEYQPHKIVDGKRVHDGPPILDYFPQIVDHDLFERVNSAASGRKSTRGGGKSQKIANLVSGLVRCRHCNGPMRYRQKAAAGSEYEVRGKTYVRLHADAHLICSAAERNVGCANKATIAYHTFETTLLNACLHIALDDNAFSNRDEISRLNNTIAERKRRLEIASDEVKNAMIAYSSRPSPARLEFLDSKEDEKAAIEANIGALNKQRDEAKGRSTDSEHLRRVGEIKDRLNDSDLTVRVPLRLKVAQALQGLISFIDCDQDRVATVALAGGMAAFRIKAGKVLDQAHALGMFRDGDYSLLVEHGGNVAPIAAAAKRLERTLADNGALGFGGAGRKAAENYTISKIQAGG